MTGLPIGAAGRFAGLALTILLFGCAMQETPSVEGYDAARAGRLFAVGYQDVSDIYIEELSIADLALSGLENLSEIDPGVAIERGEGLISLKVDGEHATSFAMPDQGDADGWGNLTAAAIDAGRFRSSALGVTDSEGLYEVVFDGLVARLDGFSRYAGREEAREHRASRDGFGGIGVRISLVDEGVKVLSVMEDTPAETAGVRDLDVITAIDGQPAAGLSQREVVNRLRGPLRSRVMLDLLREGRPEPLKISVVRGHIVPQTVSYRPENGFAYIRLSGFNQSTVRTLRDKILLAQQQAGDGLAGIILDLRNNPGGLLDQAVAVSDLFVGHGGIVSTHGRHPDSHQVFEADAEELAAGLPIGVLINGNSASASEIVAAALQDSGRAVVIGSNSFGKGTVQTVLRLPNEGELTLTWARFHAPSGYGLHRRGVLPDVCTSGSVHNVGEALAALRGNVFPIDRKLRGLNVHPGDEAALQALRARCPVHEGDNEIDLQVATQLLSDPVLYARALRGAPDTAFASPGRLTSSSEAISATAR